jgi:hypothetical protein
MTQIVIRLRHSALSTHEVTLEKLQSVGCIALQMNFVAFERNEYPKIVGFVGLWSGLGDFKGLRKRFCRILAIYLSSYRYRNQYLTFRYVDSSNFNMFR